MTPSRHVALVLLAAGCARPAARPAPEIAGGVPVIDTMALRADTWFLAHDRLRGRGTGTPGVTAAGSFIRSRCLALGLEAEELPVPLVEATVDATETRLVVDDSTFRFERDLLVAGGTARALQGFVAVPVWVGGTDQILAGDGMPPVGGRVALTAGPVRPEAAAALAGRGAVGMIHLLGDTAAFDHYRASRGDPLLYAANAAVRSSFLSSIPAIIAHPSLTAALAAATRAGRTVSYRVETRVQPVPAFNVACRLRGLDPTRRGHWIGYTAHYDHLGTGPADATGDSIYNGFSDNAAGVAMLLGIAAAIRSTPGGALRHSVLFLFFTGEERGLLGSDHYVHEPLVPLDSMAAVINLDAGAPPARVWSWRIAGGTGQALGQLAQDVSAGRGWAATTSPATPNSDYFPFAREGVPSIFIIPGSAPYEGLSADSSDALRRRWDRYHRPDDEWDAAFPFEGLARYAEFALRVGMEVDRRGAPALRPR